jgi:hypothetical protein
MNIVDARTEFLKEFKVLLEKYNVSIESEFDIELDGTDREVSCNEKMIVYHRNPNTSKEEKWIEVNGLGIDKTNFL